MYERTSSPAPCNRTLSAITRILLSAAIVAAAGCSSSSPFPALSLSQSSLTFTITTLGTVSASQTVTAQNSGGQTLNVSSVAVTGDFSQTSSGCSSLAAGASCTISVIFAPTASGTRTGTLTVGSNVGSQNVALSGAGLIPPVAALSPATVNFGNVSLNHLSAPQTLTVSNTGGSGLNISNIGVTGDYALTNGCTSTVPAGGNCQIALTFTPSALGTRPGTLTVASNGIGSPQTVSLTGSGVSGGVPFQVTVLAGTKPIAGASVQLYAPGTTGNGSSATGMLSPLPVTNANGVASIPTTYNCIATSPLIYAIATGGSVAGASSANSNVVLMSALGTCSSISSGAKFVVGEATTVAAVEALAPFYSFGGAVGASSTNSLGLANAFATAATLADPVAGTSPGSTLPANAASPAARVNSLANLLNACAVSASSCSAFYAAAAPGTVLPTNTLDALYDLVKNPGHNVAGLYTQSLAATAYAPVLSATPADWSMFINYSGGGMDSPSGIGVDSKGNVWVASYFNIASKFTSTGAAVFPNGISGSGLNNSYGMAIDLSDNVWVANEQPFTPAGIGSVSKFTSSGTSLAGNGYINGGLDYPLSIAIDPNGTVWVLDYGDSYLTLLNSSGTPLSGTTGYTTPLFAFPVAVAVDGNHFGWIANLASNSITKVAPDGSSFTNYNCCNAASGIAIDQGNNIWVANYFGDSVSLVANSGAVISSNYTGGGSVYHPQGIAVDGAGTVWVANYRAPYLSVLAGSTAAVPGAAISPSTGLGSDAGLLEAYAIALDASGNVWVSDQGSNLITKFIGMATPVKTPLSGLPRLP